MKIAEGFTPVPDELVKELGMTAALVWGRIWRYALGEYGKCTASQETIATALKMSRTTVNRHIKDLLKAGYIEQINPPNGRTNPH